jgi:TusA-related sulfurtransferase
MTAPSTEILVDARGLEPPEPMERVMQALALMRPGQSIRLLLHREPFPLYPLLAERGYRHATRMESDGSYVILIHPIDAAADAR